MNDHDIETQLRESLRRNARRAPSGASVTTRLLQRVHRRPPAHRWRTWALPLAAAAVVVITAIVIVLGHGDSATPPAVPVTPPTPPTATVANSVRSPAATSSTLSSTSQFTRAGAPAGLANLHVRDVTFDGTTEGWALASADCADGTGSCLALLRTLDGGAHWTAMTPPRARLVGEDCSSPPCVGSVRFANEQIGYAFGPDALFLTTDGGRTWALQPDMGADALDIVGDTVILVRAVNTACPDRCPLFLTSPLGSADWTPFQLTGWPPGTNTVRIASSGQRVALLANPLNIAGGAQKQPGALYLSADGGRHWTARGEQCPYVGAGYTENSYDVSVPSDGAIVIDCVVLNDAEPNFVGGITITSTDGGAHFAVPPHGGKLGAASVFAAASGTVQLAFATENGGGAARLYRSTDGGDSWSLVQTMTDAVSSIGFTSAQDGWAMAEDGRTWWTTTDGGATWARRAFG